MKDVQSFMLLVCFVAYICSSQCCISTDFNGCSLMSYGGRLMIDQNANVSPDKQLLFGSRRRFFIFQPPPGMNRRWGLHHGQFSGSGVGVIWRSNGYCQGPRAPCAVTGRRPCIDGRPPCGSEPPSYSPNRTDILQFSAITPSSINVAWPAWDESTDLGYGPVEEYRIQIREQGQAEFNEVSVGLALSHQFENLTEDTVYEFRVVIVSDHLNGVGPPSYTQAKKTSAKEPPSYSPYKGEPLQFSDITPSSVNITWPAWDVATDLGYGPIVEYRIQIKEKGQTDFEEFSAGLAFSYHFDNLTEDTEYAFRVVIVRSVRNHSAGVGPSSETQKVRTTVKEPPYYSPNRTEPLQFSDITPYSITASWPAWDEATDLGSGPVVDYKILIAELGSYYYNEVSVGLNLSHRFQDLIADTEYEFHVVIVRDHPQGTGPPSRIQMMRTAAIEPTNVEPSFNDSGEQILKNGSSWFEFSNEATADGDIQVDQFRDVVEEPVAKRKLGCSLRYGGRLRFKGDVSAKVLFRGGRKRIFIFQEPHKVRGRGRAHPGYFSGTSGRGLIWKRKGFCKGSQSVCPTTEANPCLDSKMPCSGTTPPSYSGETPLRFSDATSTSVTVTWPAWDETVDLGEGPIVTYIIEYRETGELNFHAIRKGLDLSHQFQNLVPDTEYEFHVVVVSDHPAGEGPPSREQKHRTTSEGVYIGDQNIILYPGETVTAVSGLQGAENFTIGGTPNGYSPVRNLTAIQSGVGKLSLSWNPPDLEPTLYFTVGYVVRYVLTSHIACFENGTGAEEIRLVNETEVDLTDLEDFAYYKISVSPLTRTVRPDVDIEVEGDAVSIVESTLPNGPVATLEPVEVSRTSFSSTNLKFSWNQVTCENQNGPDFHYNCVLYFIKDDRPREVITEVNVTYSSHVFTNLLPCGRYQLEVTPQNEMKSAATETVEASASPAQFGPVRNFSLTPSLGLENFTVEWRRPGDTLCPVTSYTITTTLQKQQACFQCVFEEVNVISGIQDTSYVLHDLLPFSTYIVSVTTHGNDADLTGATSDVVLVTPKRAPLMFPTVMFNGASSTQTSVMFSWDLVPCQYLNGVFSQYKYSLKLTGSDIVIEEGSIRNQSQTEITFAGLSLCTNYTFSIKVDNDAYNGQFNTIYGRTALATPGNDTNLILAPEKSEACEDSVPCLSATWRKPRSNNCPVTNQRISLYQIDDDNCRNTSELKSSFEKHATQFQQTFTELAPNSLYRVILEMGNSAESTVTTQELRTGESAPSGAPQNIRLKRPIRDGRVNITWEQPQCGQRHGIITKYEYKLRFRGDVIMTGETSNSWHSFDDLERDTSYSITVRAFSEKGSGPYTHEESNEYYYFNTRVRQHGYS